MEETPALRELAESALEHEVKRFPPPNSAEESAAAQGIVTSALIKTLVVRRGEDDYLFVLIPGDRQMDWSKLRAHLGVSRLTMPAAEEARSASGYERGAITPLGARYRWPVIADASIAASGRIAVGGGARGVSIHLDASALLDYLDAELASIT